MIISPPPRVPRRRFPRPRDGPEATAIAQGRIPRERVQTWMAARDFESEGDASLMYMPMIRNSDDFVGDFFEERK